MRAKRLTLIVIASSLALILALAYAHVMSYYPVSVSLQPISPKVVFDTGSNAGQPDIAGNIEVSVGGNGASLTITVHTTYETTYYENISIIKNTDTKAYNVNITVSQALQNLPTGFEAYLVVYSKGASRELTGWPTPQPSNALKMIDLTQTGTTQIGTINAGDVWEIDLLVYIPEGTTLPSSDTAQLYLVATPS